MRFREDKDHEWVFSYFVKLYTSVQSWKIDGKNIANTSRLMKEFVCYFFIWDGSSNYAWQNHIWLGGNKSDEKSFYKSKMIGRLLLTITVIDLQ